MFEIKKSVQIRASRERVFKALTTSDEIPKFFPLNEVTSAWEPGSEVLYKGEVGGTPFTDYGVIEELSSPSVYSYRYWSDNHGTKRIPQNYVVIRYSLAETPEGTELTLFQSNIRSKELYSLMETQVWDALLGALKNYVEAGT